MHQFRDGCPVPTPGVPERAKVFHQRQFSNSNIDLSCNPFIEREQGENNLLGCLRHTEGGDKYVCTHTTFGQYKKLHVFRTIFQQLQVQLIYIIYQLYTVEPL